MARLGASTSGMNTPSARAAAASRQRIPSNATPTSTDATSHSPPSIPLTIRSRRDVSASWAAPSQIAAIRPTTVATTTTAAAAHAVRRPSPTRRSDHPARSAGTPDGRHRSRSRSREPAERGAGPAMTPRAFSSAMTGRAPRSQRRTRTTPSTTAAMSTVRATSNEAPAASTSSVVTRRRSIATRSVAWRTATSPRTRLASAPTHVSQTIRRPRTRSRRIRASSSVGIGGPGSQVETAMAAGGSGNAATGSGGTAAGARGAARSSTTSGSWSSARAGPVTASAATGSEGSDESDASGGGAGRR